MEGYSEWDYPGTGTCLVCKIYKSMSNTIKSNFYLFADDANLYREITGDKQVELLQEDPRKLEERSKIFFCILMIINVYV